MSLIKLQYQIEVTKFTFLKKGNGGNYNDSCTFDESQSALEVITINGVGEFGNIPPFGEQCTNIMASTFTSGVGNLMERRIASAAPNQKCTERFSGKFL